MSIVRSISIPLLAILCSGCGAKWIQHSYPKDPNSITAIGNAESRLLQTAKDEATLLARRNIASQVQSRIKSMQTRFVSESGISKDMETMRQLDDAIKQVVSMELIGSRTLSERYRKKGDIYEVEVTVQYPLGETNVEMMARIKANNNLKNKINQTNFFEEMEKEVSEYEEWKRKNPLGH